MMIRKTSIVLLLCFISCLAPIAQAGHPMVTDDACTQDTGNQQLELNTDGIQWPDSYTRVGSLTYTIGFQPNLDIFVNAPITFSSPAGVDDTSIGSKWRFYEVNPVKIALKSQIILPSGEEDKGLGTGATSFAVTLIGSYDAGPWSFQGNLGLTYNRYALESDQNAYNSLLWLVTAAAGYCLTEQVKLVADTGLSRNPDKLSTDNPAYVLAGAVYSPNNRLDLDAGIKFGMGCASCAAQINRQVGIGLTTHF